MKKKVVYVLIAVILLGTAFYFGQRIAKKENVQNGNTAQPTPAVVNDESTNGWQTYRNEKYGFEFQYPGDWKVESRVDGNTNKTITQIIPNKRESCGSIMGDGKEMCLGRIELEIEDNAKAVSDLKAFFKEAWGWDENTSYKNYRTVDINGKSATRLTTIGAFDGTEDESVWFNVDNDSALNIHGIYLSENQDKIFEKIIATVKFSDKLISDWQTYRNEKYGFEFQYPKNIKIVSNNSDYVLFVYDTFNEPTAFELYLEQSIKTGQESLVGNINIGNVVAEQYVYTQGLCEEPNLCVSGVLIKKGEIEILLHGQNELSESQRKILSTFKFIK